MADVKAEERIKTTDMAPPSKRVYRAVTVKIERDVGGGNARITSQDGEIHMFVASALISKRMPAGMVMGFFRAQIEPGIGSLEICDLVRLAPEKRW